MQRSKRKCRIEELERAKYRYFTIDEGPVVGGEGNFEDWEIFKDLPEETKEQMRRNRKAIEKCQKDVDSLLQKYREKDLKRRKRKGE